MNNLSAAQTLDRNECTECHQVLPDDSFICVFCDEAPVGDSAPVPSHKRLAGVVRRLKGLVLLSVLFGLFVAPFAIVIATDALRDYQGIGGADDAEARQLRVLRRIAWGLLVAWVVLGALKLGALSRMLRSS